MGDQRQELLKSIERVFDGVELGNGVSLHETVSIDRYGGSEDRRIAREPDEKKD